MRTRLLCAVLSVCICLTATAQDLQQFIDDALARGQSKIVIPPKTWRVKPKNGQHLRLSNLKNVEISAQGAEMICTETTRAISIVNCENLTISGLSIDYDPLPFTQGVITAMTKDKSRLEFRLLDGYPENTLVKRIQIYDRVSNQLKRPTCYLWTELKPLGDRRYRVEKNSSYKYDPAIDTEEIGDYIVTNNDYAPGGRIPHAIVSDQCRNLVLRDIKVYASNCFSYFETNCDNSTYLNCVVDRRPLKDDLKKRAHLRLRSSNADAYHSKFALRGPQIINCVARYQGDDAVNICGAYHMIMTCSGKTLRVLAKREFNIKPGDTAELVSYNGTRLPDAKVIAIRQCGKINDAEKTFLKKQNMHNDMKANQHGMLTDAYEVELDRTIDLPMGSVIASANRTGNGFLVKDCDFAFNRSRGILIKASNGQVSGNKLTGNWGEAIKVSPEWWWLESGSPKNVKISGNTVKDCKTVAIAVYSHGGSGNLSPAGALADISIENNLITACPLPNIVVTSTDGLFLKDNILKPESGLKTIPWSLAKFHLHPPLKDIMTVNCENVKNDRP